MTTTTAHDATPAAAAAKAKAPTLLKNGKFDNWTLHKARRPSAAERQFYESENLEPGLSLRVTVGRRRITWFASISHDCKTTQIRLGTFPDELDCKEARDKARALFNDPQRQIQAQTDDKTFGQVSAAWYKACVEGRIRTAREVRRVLTKDLAEWETVPFAAIRRSQVMQLLDQHPPAMANHVLSILSGIFSWQSPRMPDDWTSPIERRAMRRRGLKPRDRVLAHFDPREQRIVADDLIAVWHAASDTTVSPAEQEFGRYIKFLSYSMQRRDCVISMEWTDLSADGSTWYPREPEGPGKAKGVPPSILLPQAARELLDEQRKLRGHSARVFGCIAFSRHKARFDARCPIAERWTLHDERRTSRTLMNTITIRGADGKLRRAISNEVAEACLGHAVRVSSVQGTYDVDPLAAYTTEIGDALALLADHIATLVGKNVTALPAKAA
jgi:hypothetical protein